MNYAADLRVLYEDNHLIAVNKGAGELVQGDNSGDLPLAERVKIYLKEKYGKKGNVFLGVVHRLDRPTSGVLLFARTGKALARLNRLFRDERVRTLGCRVPRKPDMEFLTDLGSRLPACSGVALGIDRLFMVHCGLRHIVDVLPFPFFHDSHGGQW